MTTNLASVTRDHDQINTCAANGARVYWHRQLPPLRAELIGEHVRDRGEIWIPERPGSGCLSPTHEQIA
jgi:hypothetical protein